MYKFVLPLIALGLSACATNTMDAPVMAPVSAACTSQSQAVFFQTGSTRLDSDASATLNNIAALYNGCDLFSLRVEGYADTVGNSQANLDLSDRRAESVLDALLARGVTADRIRVVPYGERTAPGNDSPSAYERRVVVTLMP